MSVSSQAMFSIVKIRSQQSKISFVSLCVRQIHSPEFWFAIPWVWLSLNACLLTGRSFFGARPQSARTPQLYWAGFLPRACLTILHDASCDFSIISLLLMQMCAKCPTPLPIYHFGINIVRLFFSIRLYASIAIWRQLYSLSRMCNQV